MAAVGDRVLAEALPKPPQFHLDSLAAVPGLSRLFVKVFRAL